MSLEEKINEDIKTTMRARDKQKLESLRAIKSAILLAKTQKGSSGEMNESGEINLLQKLVKQREESAEIYKQQGRPELYDKEIFEAEIIKKYLPEQLSDDDLKLALNNIINETGVRSIKDMGKVMGVANKTLKGKAQGKRIADMVKFLLNT